MARVTRTARAVVGVSVPRYPPVNCSHLHPLARPPPSPLPPTLCCHPTTIAHHLDIDNHIRHSHSNCLPQLATPNHSYSPHYYHLSSPYQKWSKLSSQVLPVSLSSSFRGLAIPSRSDHPLGPSRCAVAGGIGQPLSLLLKLNPIVTELSLYDVVNAPGVSLHSWL